MRAADIHRGDERPVASRAPAAAPGRAGESGFSMVELLVALSILIFTLVALMTLANTSSFMVSTSRQRAAMVNAASGYLERAQQEAYGNVGTPGGNPAGDLVTQVTTSSPYVVTIVPTVTWGRPEDPTNHNLKTIVLTVSSVNISGGSLLAFEASTLVADIGTVGSVSSGSGLAVTTTPTVQFTSPANGAVVWGPAVSVSASATALAPSTTLVFLNVLDGSTPWGAVTVSGTSAQHVWTWNTTTAREGNHLLVPQVTDSQQSSGSGPAVTLLVDNSAPIVPGSLASLFPSGSGATVSWSASTDGTGIDGSTPLPASHYIFNGYRQPTSTGSASDYTEWSAVSGISPLSVTTAPSTSSPLSIPGLAGFSRYVFAVSASSPDRGSSSGLLSAPATTVGVTEDTPSGTWTVTQSGKNYTVSVSVNVPTGPTFPWTGTATTRFYRLTSATQAVSSGTLIGTVSSAYPTWSTAAATDTQTTKNSSPVAWYYAAITTLTPTGYGSSSITVESCVLAPPNTSNTTVSGSLVFSLW
jgi:type II secretory pathway pseudopilin PulG